MRLYLSISDHLPGGKLRAMALITVAPLLISCGACETTAQDTSNQNTTTQDKKAQDKSWTSPDGIVKLTLHSEMELSENVPERALGFWGMNEGYTRLLVAASFVPAHIEFKKETIEKVFRKELQGEMISSHEEIRNGVQTFVFEGTTSIGGYDEIMIQTAFKVDNTFYKCFAACKADDERGKQIIKDFHSTIEIRKLPSAGLQPANPRNAENEKKIDWEKLTGQIGGACLLFLIIFAIYNKMRS